MIYYSNSYDEAEEIIREARRKRFNYISEVLDSLFDSDKEEDLKLKEELKNDSSR